MSRSICLFIILQLCVTCFGLSVSYASSCQEGETDKAQLNANSLLWAITKKNGDHKGFLFGTLHVGGTWVELMLRKLAPLIRSVDGGVVELVEDPMEKLQFARSMLLSGSTQLNDFFTAEEYARIQYYLKNTHHPERLKLLKPWVVFVGLYSPKKNYSKTMDDLLHTSFSDLKYPVIGLETVKEQLAVFDVLTLEQQAQLVKTALKHYENTAAKLELDMFEQYRKGDLIALWELHRKFVQQMGPNYMPLHQATLMGRNKKIIQKLLEVLKFQSAFIAVGALHLPGNEGLICLLEKEGYRVSAFDMKGLQR